jgi:hypothetical protein
VCVSDWRLGQLVTFETTSELLGNGGTMTIPANANRVGVIAGCADNFATGVFTIKNPTLPIMSVPLDNLPYSITLLTHGRLPQQSLAFQRFGSIANLNTFVIELFMPREYIAAALESFRSEYGQFLSTLKL